MSTYQSARVTITKEPRFRDIVSMGPSGPMQGAMFDTFDCSIRIESIDDKLTQEIIDRIVDLFPELKMIASTTPVEERVGAPPIGRVPFPGDKRPEPTRPLSRFEGLDIE